MKYVAIIFLPIALIALVRQRAWVALVLGGGVSIVGALLLFLPFFEGGAMFRKLRLVGTTYFSLPYYHPMQWFAWALQGVGVHGPAVLIRPFGNTVFLVVAAGAYLLQTLQKISPHQGAALVIIGFLLFATLYFLPWYLLWVIVLLPLVGWRVSRWAVPVVAIVGAASFPLY